MYFDVTSVGLRLSLRIKALATLEKFRLAPEFLSAVAYLLITIEWSLRTALASKQSNFDKIYYCCRPAFAAICIRGVRRAGAIRSPAFNRWVCWTFLNRWIWLR